MITCSECKREIKINEEKFFYGNRLVCEACIDELTGHRDTCPCCGGILGPEDIDVGLFIPTKAGKAAGKGRRSVKKEVPVMVCPRCQSLFLHKFVYRALNSADKAS